MAAKDAFVALLGMNPQQQAAYLKSLPPGMLQRLGTFAYLGSGDTQINGIRDAISKEVTNRGGDPVSIGAAPKKAKAAAKGKAGGKSSSGGKSGGASKPSGSKASSSSSKAQKPTAAKAAPKVIVKPAKQPARGPVVAPPQTPIGSPTVQVPTTNQDLAIGRIPVKTARTSQTAAVARRNR